MRRHPSPTFLYLVIIVVQLQAFSSRSRYSRIHFCNRRRALAVTDANVADRKETIPLLVSLDRVTHSFDPPPWKRLLLPPGSRPGQALVDVNLDVPRGTVLAACGESGSGKSTLLAILSRRLKPQSGTVSFANGCRTHLVGDIEFKAYRAQLAKAGSLASALDMLVCNSAVRGTLLDLLPNSSARRPWSELPTAVQCSACIVMALAQCYKGDFDEIDLPPEPTTASTVDQIVERSTQSVTVMPLLLMDELLDGRPGPSAWATTSQREEIDRTLRAACKTLGASAVYATHCDHHASLSDRVLFLSRGELKQQAPPSDSVYWKWKSQI